MLVLIFSYSKSSDELKQQNSELSEKLNALLSENAATKLELGDLHKKLEMAELMIQQVSFNATRLFLVVEIHVDAWNWTFDSLIGGPLPQFTLLRRPVLICGH